MWTLMLYLMAATLLTIIFLGVYLWFAWDMNSQRLTQMVAIAQGYDLIDAVRKRVAEKYKSRDQSNMDEIIERRAAQGRDWDLRNLAIREGMEEVKYEQRLLAEKHAHYEKVTAAFTARLQQLKEEAESEGMQELQRILIAIDPEQAKNQIMEMVKKGEDDVVVQLLRGMEDRPRSKIIGEMTTEAENTDLADILQRLREGEPETTIADDAMADLAGPADEDAAPPGAPPGGP